jgi:hypothetical protein
MKSLASIWSIIEASRSMPVVILAASATADDDVACVAQGLVKASKDAGRHTGYLALGGGLAPKALSLVLPPGSSCAAYDDLLREWRETYEVIIVELPQVLTNELGPHIARTADGVIVVVRDKRLIQHADRELSKLLKRLGAQLIGAVAVAPAPAAMMLEGVVAHSKRALRMDAGRVRSDIA